MAAEVTPARVGLLIDYLKDGDAPYDQNILPALQLVADEYLAAGVLERPVEFVVRAVQGLPNGSFRHVRDAFHELVDEDALVAAALANGGQDNVTAIADMLDALPPELQDQVVPVFITVDPERDTAAVLHDYVPQFSPRLVGLTGSEAEIAATLRAYRVYAAKSEAPATEGGYLVDHSTFTYLMGRDGKYLTHFGHGTTPEDMVKSIAKLAAEG